jgi:ribosome-binding ATPase YchF (GTP1/OBG family)
MNLSLGIVGLPNVGKSTLFKLLTKQEVNIANYPFTTINPNVAVLAVPDERLEKVAQISKPEKTVPAVVEFFDIAGLVKGANKGEGLGNQFLAQIRETNAIIQTVRCFPNPEIVHIEGNINPLRDMETVNTELMLKDLETIIKRIEKIIGEAKSGQKQAIKELEILNRIKAELEKGNLLITVFEKAFLEDPIIKNLNLLTAKKQIYLLNGNEKDLPQTVITKVQAVKGDYVIANLENNPDLLNLIKKAYEILDLISFFTIVGEQEARAWPAKRGTKAIEAAGMIHSDFEKKFIKAEVINWQKLVEAENWANARQKGWIRLEGKEYEIQDGDVIIIKHG